MSLSAGVKARYFAILGGLFLVGAPLLWQFVMADYQKARFTAVFNLDDPTVQMEDGYQQYQGRISIGSGRLDGMGLFNGIRVADNAVPFQQSDYIFSVAGEELGFLGCSLILLLLLLFMCKVLHVAHSSRDDMGKYICFGFFGMIALQSVSNIGMCLALLPAMGVTLPFFSAGGSSRGLPVPGLRPGAERLHASQRERRHAPQAPPAPAVPPQRAEGTTTEP